MVKVRKGCAQRTHTDAWLFCKGDPHATSEGHALLTELPSGDVMDGFEEAWVAFSQKHQSDEFVDPPMRYDFRAGFLAARGGKP